MTCHSKWIKSAFLLILLPQQQHGTGSLTWFLFLHRLDKYRPKKEGEAGDVTFEGHIFFDDAFTDVAGSRGAHVNQYAEMLVNIIAEVYR